MLDKSSHQAETRVEHEPESDVKVNGNDSRAARVEGDMLNLFHDTTSRLNPCRTRAKCSSFLDCCLGWRHVERRGAFPKGTDACTVRVRCVRV